LQTSALPLGYAAEKKGFFPTKEASAIEKCGDAPAAADRKHIELERETGFEPATATLAR
jgi:hypothetical protein